MFDIMKKAVQHFISSIEADIDECDKKSMEGFVSKIEINGDENYDIYIIIPHEKLSYIADYYFGEESYDAEDLTKEIANQIAGNAKLIAAEYDKNFNISVPEYLGEYKNGIDYDDMLAFRFNGGKCFFILFKEKK